MVNSHSTIRFGQRRGNRRWFVASFLTRVLLAAEIAEHRPDLPGHVDFAFLPEVIVFSVICPLLVGIVLPEQVCLRLNRLDGPWRKHMWCGVALLGLVVSAGEFAEHWTGNLSLAPDLLPEVLAYGIALPLIGGMLLTFQPHHQIDQVGLKLLQRPWAVMLFSGLVVITVELIAHHVTSLRDISAELVSETLALGVVLPLACGILLAELLRPKLASTTALIADQAAENERRRIARASAANLPKGCSFS